MANPTFCVIAVVLMVLGVATSQQTNATCDLIVNPSLAEEDRQAISGTIDFSQQAPGGTVTLQLNIVGFNTTDGEDKHGFHVHASGDISTDGCQSTGGHFNPHGVPHAAKENATRHVGDLGNIEEDGSGRVITTMTDDIIDFTGTNDISSRAIVIHALEDDLGLGGDSGSESTGNAGARLACCVITVTSGSASLMTSLSIIPSCLAFLFIRFIKHEMY